MRAYPDDLRARVLAACDGGRTTGAVAERLAASASRVRRVTRVRRESGRVTAAPPAGGRTPAWVTHGEAIRRAVRDDPDATREEYRTRHALPVSRAALDRAPAALDLPRKKKPARASERGRPDVRAKREGWPAQRAGVPAERLAFPDETGANTAMTRTHGRCPAGERLACAVPAGHGKTTTFAAALRADGRTAPTAVGGAMGRAAFEAWVARQLVPVLRPGEVVALDDLSAHTGPKVRELVEGATCRVAHLPPYGPDRDPVEKAWSKPKAKLRAAAERTVDELWRFLGEMLDTFAPEECRNYFRSCGYSPATPDREPL